MQVTTIAILIFRLLHMEIMSILRIWKIQPLKV